MESDFVGLGSAGRNKGEDRGGQVCATPKKVLLAEWKTLSLVCMRQRGGQRTKGRLENEKVLCGSLAALKPGGNGQGIPNAASRNEETPIEFPFLDFLQSDMASDKRLNEIHLGKIEEELTSSVLGEA